MYYWNSPWLGFNGTMGQIGQRTQMCSAAHWLKNNPFRSETGSYTSPVQIFVLHSAFQRILKFYSNLMIGPAWILVIGSAMPLSKFLMQTIVWLHWFQKVLLSLLSDAHHLVKRVCSRLIKSPTQVQVWTEKRYKFLFQCFFSDDYNSIKFPTLELIVNWGFWNNRNGLRHFQCPMNETFTQRRRETFLIWVSTWTGIWERRQISDYHNKPQKRFEGTSPGQKSIIVKLVYKVVRGPRSKHTTLLPFPPLSSSFGSALSMFCF